MIVLLGKCEVFKGIFNEDDGVRFMGVGEFDEHVIVGMFCR